MCIYIYIYCIFIWEKKVYCKTKFTWFLASDITIHIAEKEIEALIWPFSSQLGKRETESGNIARGIATQYIPFAL